MKKLILCRKAATTDGTSWKATIASIRPAAAIWRDYTLPITEISHPEGEAVIGGFVYHGQAIPAMDGMYVFGDLNGKIWALTENPANTFTRSQLMDTGFNISSFGRDAAGELYVVDISAGRVLKIVPM